MRAVLGGLLAQPTKIWTQQGVEQYLSMMQDLDKRNPLLASRLIQGLSNWNALVADKKSMVKQALILSQANMSSKNVKETLQSMLNNL